MGSILWALGKVQIYFSVDAPSLCRKIFKIVADLGLRLNYHRTIEPSKSTSLLISWYSGCYNDTTLAEISPYITYL